MLTLCKSFGFRVGWEVAPGERGSETEDREKRRDAATMWHEKITKTEWGLGSGKNSSRSNAETVNLEFGLSEIEIDRRYVSVNAPFFDSRRLAPRKRFLVYRRMLMRRKTRRWRLRLSRNRA